jgi:small subunit ribosomal protein S16
MLTARPCDALSSFAGPGSSVRSCRLFPRSARFRRIASQRWEKTTAVAVKIKLKRLGKIREPYYRIVVADARTKRDGRAIEEIGKYHPKADPSLIEVNSERVQHWLSVGAQPTDPVRVLLKITGDWQKFTGEPGTEGTLRTAERRADKKERFEAAAKESQATKAAKEGAKESKAATRASKPARSTAAKDSAAKDSAPKDSAVKDSTAKDSAPKAKAKAPAAEAADAASEAPAEASAAEASAPEASAPEAKAAEAEAADADASASDAKAAAGDSGSGA